MCGCPVCPYRCELSVLLRVWAFFILVCCSSSLITEYPWCLESLILGSGSTCPCCCWLLVLCWLVLPGGVILLEPFVCMGWDKKCDRTEPKQEKCSNDQQPSNEGCDTCDSISFTFQRMIQRFTTHKE